MNQQKKGSPIGDGDAVNQAAAEALKKAGLIPMDAALFICDFIGKELQGIPSHNRQLAIARLRNKAKLLQNAGFPYDADKLIEAVCRGWETF